MKKRTRTCSSSPNPYLFSSHYLLCFSLRLPAAKATTTTTLALLLLLLGVSSVSAQTRTRRARRESDETAARVDDKKRAGGVVNSGGPDKARQVTSPSLVRKTALIYTPQPVGQSTKRQVLVNDINVVSRVGEESSPVLRLPNAPNTGAASANRPSIWPVAGPLSSGFGTRSNPFGGSSREFHKGQDISAPTGTPVMATADGTVVIAGWLRGYGWVVYIDHGNGISTRYGHLSRIDVAVNQKIKRGEQLGLVGSTGRSTGPHLHYEVLINGQQTNPLLFLPAAQRSSQ